MSSSSRTRRRSVTSPLILVWQASRNSGGKPSRSAIASSLGVRSPQAVQPSTTTTRHVEQDAWPPQAWANGTPARSAADRIVSVALHSVSFWSGRMYAFATAGHSPGQGWHRYVRIDGGEPPSRSAGEAPAQGA